MNRYVDVIVPRGGKSLIERISNEARVPVIKHLDGNCHTFVDRDANFDYGNRYLRQCQNSPLRHL